MGLATLIKKGTSSSGAMWECFQLDPPLAGHEYVRVSAVIAPFSGPETYLFPADSDGEVTDWGELEGSYRGGLDINEALHRAGYDTIIRPELEREGLM
jgi:hypothetical protein